MDPSLVLTTLIRLTARCKCKWSDREDEDEVAAAGGTGGDDVNQLCEAGEEEFLEIMALVGMASKPLHVRRLQKALLEWIVEPGCHSFISITVRSLASSLSSWFINAHPVMSVLPFSN